ncbi:glycosyltransferase [Capnocytophaga ochracea]|nr:MULTISPECIES: glycosyltransferase [Capnocytophaga]MEB3016157.1 glycosyltransferase [Capnocytophaga ochracea]MEB3036314.1 glycosyltransferase [Capnocytophaga ochracea]
MSKLASEGQNLRKETEKFGRGEVGFLMKKGCKKGGGSL